MQRGRKKRHPGHFALRDSPAGQCGAGAGDRPDLRNARPGRNAHRHPGFSAVRPGTHLGPAVGHPAGIPALEPDPRTVVRFGIGTGRVPQRFGQPAAVEAIAAGHRTDLRQFRHGIRTDHRTAIPAHGFARHGLPTRPAYLHET